MKVHQIFTNSPLRNFTYVIEGANKHCMVIDPYDGEKVLEYIHQLSGVVRGVINTHEHDDHTCGNSTIIKKTACVVYAHSNARGKVPGANQFLGEKDSILIDEETHLEVLDTPGHTFAHLCFLLVHKGACVGVFTGDTLFNAGTGHCRLGGDIDIYFKTMEEKFKKIHDDVVVYPGHEYLENNLNFTLSIEEDNQKAKELIKFSQGIDWEKETYQNTMGQEREVNLFLRLANESVRGSLNGCDWSDHKVFKELRHRRDHW